MYVRNVKKLVAFILCTFICAIVLLQFTCTYAFAQQANVPRVQEKTFVYDQEELLSTDQKETLNTVLRYLEEQTSIEFAVITSSSYFGMNIDDYAHDLFNTLKIGKADKDNGILLLVSAKEGHARLEIGYGLESLLTDSICGRILDKYYVPNRDNGKNTESVYETAFGVLAFLGEEYGIDIIENQKAIASEIKNKDSIERIIKTVVSIILVILVVILDYYLGSSGYGGRYHGGFSSRGGGGHFGGGHSGGGGAHR